MFGKKTEAKPQGRIDSLISTGTVLEGCIRFSGGLRIDGQVIGRVIALDAAASSATLMLSDQARIEGEVQVGHLVMSGTIVGPVSVKQSIEMQARARIVGDVEYASIEMHQGAVIEGRLVHRQGGVVDSAEPLVEPISVVDA